MASDPSAQPDVNALLSRVLIERAVITRVERRAYGPGVRYSDEVLSENRLHAVLRGGMTYHTAEGPTTTRRGQVYLLTPWTRRRIEVGPAGCELLSCLFSFGELGMAVRPILVDPGPGVALQRQAMRRMLDVWDREGQAGGLVLEGELKAVLARMLGRIGASGGPAPASSSVMESRSASAVEVAEMVTWLDANFRDPDVLRQAVGPMHTSRRHAADLFKRQTGQTMSRYVLMLRMQAARYALRHTAKPVREVARSVGFADALYFSRRYRRFWKRAPSDDRGG